jgi:hypothetical protein
LIQLDPRRSTPPRCLFFPSSTLARLHQRASTQYSLAMPLLPFDSPRNSAEAALCSYARSAQHVRAWPCFASYAPRFPRTFPLRLLLFTLCRVDLLMQLPSAHLPSLRRPVHRPSIWRARINPRPPISLPIPRSLRKVALFLLIFSTRPCANDVPFL